MKPKRPPVLARRREKKAALATEEARSRALRREQEQEDGEADAVAGFKNKMLVALSSASRTGSGTRSTRTSFEPW